MSDEVKGEGKKDEVAAIVILSTENTSMTANTWIGDSGASHHMLHSEVGLFNKRQYQESVTFGNGNQAKVKYLADLNASFLNKSGNQVPLIITNVSYIPNLWCTRFRLKSPLNLDSN